MEFLQGEAKGSLNTNMAWWLFPGAPRAQRVTPHPISVDALDHRIGKHKNVTFRTILATSIFVTTLGSLEATTYFGKHLPRVARAAPIRNVSNFYCFLWKIPMEHRPGREGRKGVMQPFLHPTLKLTVLLSNFIFGDPSPTPALG